MGTPFKHTDYRTQRGLKQINGLIGTFGEERGLDQLDPGARKAKLEKVDLKNLYKNGFHVVYEGTNIRETVSLATDYGTRWLPSGEVKNGFLYPNKEVYVTVIQNSDLQTKKIISSEQVVRDTDPIPGANDITRGSSQAIVHNDYIELNSLEIRLKSDSILMNGENLEQKLAVLAQNEFNAQNLLTMLLTIDGPDSEIDADMVDGKHATEFASSDHDHNSEYLGINAEVENCEKWDGVYGYDGMVLRGQIENIEGGEDLNNYTETGIWGVPSYQTAANGLNFPEGHAGILQVMSNTYNDSMAMIVQIYYIRRDSHAQDVWMRKRASNVWGSWYKFLTADGKAADSDKLDGYHITDVMVKKGDIPGSADLNTYTTTGLYFQHSWAQANTGTNYPEVAAGMLEVTTSAADGNTFIYQRYTNFADGRRVWGRAKLNDTWYDWLLLSRTAMDGEIGENVDLDTYTTSGLYLQPNNYKASTGTNYPVALAGYLEVINTWGTYILQRYTTYYTNDVYIRSKYSTEPWLAWGKMWNSYNDGTDSGLNADLLRGYSPAASSGTANAIIQATSGGLLSNTYQGIAGTFVASESISANQIVNIWDDGGTLKIRKADGNQNKWYWAHGFVKASVTVGNSATVYYSGVLTTTGKTPGYPQYLSKTPGEVTQDPGELKDDPYQYIGFAMDTTHVLINIGEIRQFGYDIFEEIKTYDGTGSGFDADLVDGKHASDFSLTDHNHTGTYLPAGGTAVDSDKLDGFDAYAGVFYKGTLGSSDNLNDFIENGIWVQTSGSYATTANNYPEPRVGLLEVFGSEGSHIGQRYSLYSTYQRVWFRYKYSTTWGEWFSVDLGTQATYTVATVAEAGDGNLTGGNVVNIFDIGGGVYKIRKARADDVTKPAHGFILRDAAEGTSVQVLKKGLLISSAKTRGARYYLSATTPGSYSTTKQTTLGYIRQEVAMAMSDTVMAFNIQAPIFLGDNDNLGATGGLAPSTGTHVQGEIKWNNSPTAGGWMGWVCTTGGTPGTWKRFGQIEA